MKKHTTVHNINYNTTCTLYILNEHYAQGSIPGYGIETSMDEGYRQRIHNYSLTSPLSTSAVKFGEGEKNNFSLHIL